MLDRQQRSSDQPWLRGRLRKRLREQPSHSRAHWHVSANRKRRSSGNTVLEMVFTLLPTFALIFGFIDIGLMIYRWNTLQNAVREGVRYAVTFQRQTVAGNTLGQDASIKNVVQQYAMGMVTATQSPAKIFVNYYTRAAMTTALSSGGNVPGNIVQVSVEGVSFSWLAPLSGSYGAGIPFFRSTDPLTLNVYSVAILGGYPVGVTSVPR